MSSKRDERQITTMRRRRAKTPLQQILEIEAQVEHEWEELRRQQIAQRTNGWDWLEETRQLTRHLVKDPEPSLRQVVAHAVRRYWQALRRINSDAAALRP